MTPSGLEKIILDETAMSRAISRISYEIIERNKGLHQLCLVGLQSRGVELAHRVAQRLYQIEKIEVPVGELDITRFRDDKSVPDPYEDRSHIPFSIADQTVILVDDVIYTGRSVRCAIDAVVRRGRPKRIQLAVLVDRGHREIPIRADFIGKNLPTSQQEEVCVCVKERDGLDQVSIRFRERDEVTV